MSEWFKDWFDSKYYHILYRNRGNDEAQRFIQKMTSYLNLKKGAFVLDLACGKGRHSIYLNKLGYDVLGVDLSENSIESAKLNENETLKFEVHDMRLPLKEYKFDAVLNLFTSFGYFKDKDVNLTMLESIHSYLKKDGYLIIDFMNTVKVSRELKQSEIKEVDGIEFNIKRKSEENFICKYISFEDNGREFNFEEHVQSLVLADFEGLLKSANFELIDKFGDYELNSFSEDTSQRLIIIAQQK